MLLPGPNRFQFTNFVVSEETVNDIKENILSDFVELLPEELTDVRKNRQRALAASTFDVCREILDETDETVNPLIWWPSHPEYTILYPVAKMLLQIPAASAENERSFSSASFLLNERRTRLDIENFRREHRIRRHLCAGTTLEEKLGLSNNLLEEFSRRVNVANEAEQ